MGINGEGVVVCELAGDTGVVDGLPGATWVGRFRTGDEDLIAGGGS